jgi:hypothetical protein
MACQIGLLRGLGLLGPNPIGLARGLGLRGPRPIGLRGPRGSRGVVESPWSWGRAWQAAGVILVVGKVVPTLHPPPSPLSHNVNPRDGAQDIPANPTPAPGLLSTQLAAGARGAAPSRAIWFKAQGALSATAETHKSPCTLTHIVLDERHELQLRGEQPRSWSGIRRRLCIVPRQAGRHPPPLATCTRPRRAGACCAAGGSSARRRGIYGFGGKRRLTYETHPLLQLKAKFRYSTGDYAPHGGISTAPTRTREGPVSLFTVDRRQSITQELLGVTS